MSDLLCYNGYQFFFLSNRENFENDDPKITRTPEKDGMKDLVTSNLAGEYTTKNTLAKTVRGKVS